MFCFSYSKIDGISVNAGICRLGLCENRSVRYLNKWHRIKSHTLTEILFLIFILVFQEISDRDIKCAFLIHQIVHIHVNNQLQFCDTLHNTNSITE
jgi:hypothetical protein